MVLSALQQVRPWRVMCRARGETAVEGAVKAGKAAQEAIPKGATQYKTREDRNDECALLKQLCTNTRVRQLC